MHIRCTLNFPPFLVEFHGSHNTTSAQLRNPNESFNNKCNENFAFDSNENCRFVENLWLNSDGKQIPCLIKKAINSNSQTKKYYEEMENICIWHNSVDSVYNDGRNGKLPTFAASNWTLDWMTRMFLFCEILIYEWSFSLNAVNNILKWCNLHSVRTGVKNAFRFNAFNIVSAREHTENWIALKMHAHHSMHNSLNSHKYAMAKYAWTMTTSSYVNRIIKNAIKIAPPLKMQWCVTEAAAIELE